MDNMENVSFRKAIINFHTSTIHSLLKEIAEKDKRCPAKPDDAILGYVAFMKAVSNYDKIVDTVMVPEPFASVLDKDMSKKEQVRVLKGAELSDNQLLAVFNYAETKGYTFSNYRYEGAPKNITDKDELPSFMRKKDDGSIEYIGNTTLTEGQMRTIIDQAEVLIVRLFDNGKHWHCFLQTFRGLKGQESGEQGKRPHLHYLSDSFGIKKEDLISMVKRGKYPQTPIHIPLIDKK